LEKKLFVFLRDKTVCDKKNSAKKLSETSTVGFLTRLCEFSSKKCEEKTQLTFAKNGGKRVKRCLENKEEREKKRESE